MERRDFILKSGTILTAAAFFGMFGNSNNLFGATTNSADKKIVKSVQTQMLLANQF